MRPRLRGVALFAVGLLLGWLLMRYERPQPSGASAQPPNPPTPLDAAPRRDAPVSEQPIRADGTRAIDWPSAAVVLPPPPLSFKLTHDGAWWDFEEAEPSWSTESYSPDASGLRKALRDRKAVLARWCDSHHRPDETRTHTWTFTLRAVDGRPGVRTMPELVDGPADLAPEERIRLGQYPRCVSQVLTNARFSPIRESPRSDDFVTVQLVLPDGTANEPWDLFRALKAHERALRKRP